MAMVDSTKFSPSTATQNRKFASELLQRGERVLSTARTKGMSNQSRNVGFPPKVEMSVSDPIGGRPESP